MFTGTWMRFALSTVAVAFALILALPVSQLRLLTLVEQCCCPDPDHCQCPDHPSDSSQPTLSQCHKTIDTLESTGGPSFAPSVAIAELVPTRVPVAVHHTDSMPHEPPSPERPSAPS